ncbi:uncharacterized protein [Clytia hemisphaerica]|uniref:Cnidarian restricted protein n=1 Tax=Clytia hemisphaerica TaxID=252671 RepID=A0A7M5V2I5_9CNID
MRLYVKELCFLLILAIPSFEAVNKCQKRQPENFHGTKPIIYIKAMKAFSGGLIKYIPVQSPEWELTLSIKFNSFIMNQWKGILHFTNGSALLNHGSRVPILIMKGSMLQISSSVNNNGDHSYFKYNLVLNTVYNIKVAQYYISNGHYRYFIEIDGIEVESTVNTKPTQFYNVAVYLLQRSKADCDVTNLKFVNFL